MMKRLLLCFSVLLIGSVSFASEGFLLPSQLIQYELKLLEARAQMIDWEVGEWTSYGLKTTFGAGKVRKEVTSDEGEALWLTSDVELMGQKQKAEALIRKADGKVLKLLVDGKEQDLPDAGGFEIIEQKEDNITVPKFPNGIDCIYLKIKEKEKGNIIQTWINPRDIALDGTAKMTTKQGFMTVTMELTDMEKVK